MYTDLKLYIDGQWLNGAEPQERGRHQSGDRQGARPSCRTPRKADLDAALAAADKGFKVWRAMSAYDRAKIMRKAADLAARARRPRRAA